MTTLILVRHAEAEGNILRRFHGHTDSGLTPNGYKQLAKLKKRMKTEHIDVLYSSDLVRTYETAKAISEAKNLNIKLDKQLREIYGGIWEDKTWEELEKDWYDSFIQWEKQPHLLKIPGGESMIDFKERIVGCINKIILNNLNKNICVVTHGTVIKVLLSYFYGKKLNELDQIMWHDNASITKVKIIDNKFEVISDGDNDHLGELSTFSKQDWWKKESEVIDD